MYPARREGIPTDQIKQISHRMHEDDYRLMKKLLIDDEIRFAEFMDACVLAYLRGDPLVMSIIRDYKELSCVPKHKKDGTDKSYVFSNRDRAALLDDFTNSLERKEKKSE